MKHKNITQILTTYFYTVIFLIFILLVISFHLGGQIHTGNLLRQHLNRVQRQVENFASSSDLPKGQQRRNAFHKKMIADHNSPVEVMFVNDALELTLPFSSLDSPQDSAMPGGSGQRRQGLTMQLEPGNYQAADSIYQALKAQSYHLADGRVQAIQVAGESYLVQSIPFNRGAETPEYVVAYIATKPYNDFLQSGLFVLGVIMIPTLILSYVLLRAVANRVAKPIKQLVGLSQRLGTGDFQGEDFSFKTQELKELNESLNDSALKLSTYQENQKVFFQNVSHELRTPLTNIHGYAEGLLYGVFDKEEGAQVIKNESLRLEKLVDNLLYLSRIQANESLVEEKTRISLRELLLTTGELVSARARMLGIDFKVCVEKDLTLSLYYSEMERGLENLLTNALRYAKSQVVLAGGIQDQDVWITVSDDGPGIEKGKEEDIFLRFHKGSDGNHGIGLSIAKACVQRQGGRIFADRAELGGARFTMIWPKSAFMP